MDNILVSVIVPIYNVEKYLAKCIESIINQSHKNIEIILVDDGSPDSCPRICDEYAKKDKRIKVIHKKNGGVSKARNDGIDIAIGDYLVFVDADDYLAQEYIDYMLGMVFNNNCEFGFSKNCYFSNNQEQINDNIIIVDSNKATALLLSQQVIVGCWNKIYKTSFLKSNNIYFSDKLFYGEGLNFIIKVANSTSKIAVGSKRVYFYRKNNSSSATSKFNIKKHYNGEKSLKEIQKNIDLKSDIVYRQYMIHYTLYCLNAVEDLYTNKMHKTYKSDYKRWLQIINDNKSIILKYKELTRKEKFKLILVSISPKLLSFFHIIKSKWIFKNSI